VCVIPSFIDRLLGTKIEKIQLVQTGVLIEFTSGEIKSCKLDEIKMIPELLDGVFFSKLILDSQQRISLRFLSNKNAKLIQSQVAANWFEGKHIEFDRLANELFTILHSGYIRSSKLDKVSERLELALDAFKSYNPKELVTSKVARPYIYLLELRSDFHLYVEQARGKYVDKEVLNHNEYFDEVESNPLTSKQKIACVVDDDQNLVLAGAGTGKTSTMVAKAGYLLKSGKASSEEILLLAYGAKAATELDERIKDKLETDSIKASTFHALGKSILQTVEKKSISVSLLATDSQQLDKFVDDEFQKLLKSDQEYSDFAKKYFESYLYPAKNMLDFKTQGEYLEYLKNNEVRTLNGELLKSYEEVVIANFLFVNGIEYKYEAEYEVDAGASDFKKYRPDFFLPEYGVYIEHFGINKNGDTAPWVNKEKYNQEIEWKRSLHDINETILLETFHYQRVDGSLLSELKNQLLANDVKLKPLKNEEIFDNLREFGQLDIFSKLLARLIENIKGCCIDSKAIIELAELSENRLQAKAALKLLNPILKAYQDTLKETGEIDFHDMIRRSITYVEKGYFKPTWKYILVDEFQDISEPRARLVKVLQSKMSDASIFCVGDDWQSIYRFSGSDIRFTTEFESLFGMHSTVTLDKTFRFNNKISEVASSFVSKNPSQVQKNISTHLTTDTASVSILRTEKCCDLSEIRKVLDKIETSDQSGATVFILSRFKYLLPDGIQALNREYPSLTIERGMTMHASKGKEADYVILIGLQKGKSGFPSEKTTHPLLEVYLPSEDAFKNAEERRLLYVAMTRARHKAFIVADMGNASIFTEELIEGDYEVLLDEFDIDENQKVSKSPRCPKCETGALYRRGEKGSQFRGCSNYPLCEYTESVCDWCESDLIRLNESRKCSSKTCNFIVPLCTVCFGDMVPRSSQYGKFWGCSNFRGDSVHSCKEKITFIDLKSLN